MCNSDSEKVQILKKTKFSGWMKMFKVMFFKGFQTNNSMTPPGPVKKQTQKVAAILKLPPGSHRR